MPKPRSRRSILAAGLALAPVAALPALPADSDAELIRLGAALDAAWKAQNISEGKDDSAEFMAAYNFARDIVDRILNVQARSIEGLCVKARALSWCHSGEFEGILPGPGELQVRERTTDICFVDSICRDLLVISGEA